MTDTTSTQTSETPANDDDNRACPSCSRPGVVRPDLTITPHDVHGLASPCDAPPSLIPDDYNTSVLSAQWTATPNNEIGGWAVSADGRSPLDGGVMAADLVMTRELAEHIADLHNRNLDAAAGVDYAVRVTLHDGTSSIRHEDDPFTDRSSAEQAAWHSRLGGAVASAEVVCQQVWHGPWTAPPEATGR